MFKPTLNTNNMKRSELFDHFDIVDRYMFTHSTGKVEICGHYPPPENAPQARLPEINVLHTMCVGLYVASLRGS